MSELNLNKAQPIGLDLSKAKPIELIDDEIESDGAPCGLAASPKVEVRCGFTKIEDAYPFIEGLETFDFAAPRGLEGVKGESWKNYHAFLLESVGQAALAHHMYANIGCGFNQDHLTRKAATVEQLKAAVLEFADRKVDLAKPGYQFQISDWEISATPQIVRVGDYHIETSTGRFPAASRARIPSQIPVPKHEDPGVLPAIMSGQSIPPIRATCRICSAVMPGQAPPHHDCSQYQF